VLLQDEERELLAHAGYCCPIKYEDI